jgi:hypothetical protein
MGKGLRGDADKGGKAAVPEQEVCSLHAYLVTVRQSGVKEAEVEKTHHTEEVVDKVGAKRFLGDWVEYPIGKYIGGSHEIHILKHGSDVPVIEENIRLAFALHDLPEGDKVIHANGVSVGCAGLDEEAMLYGHETTTLHRCGRKRLPHRLSVGAHNGH